MSGSGAPEPIFEALIEVGLNDHDAAMHSLEEDGRVFGAYRPLAVARLRQNHSSEPPIQQLVAEVR